MKLVASLAGRDGSLTIHQDTDIYLSNLSVGVKVTHRLAPDRYGWLQVMRGTVRVGANELLVGDAVAIAESPEIDIEALAPAEIILFDLS